MYQKLAQTTRHVHKTLAPTYNRRIQHSFFRSCVTSVSHDRLPVLEHLVKRCLASSHFSAPPLKNTAVVYIHHPLRTSINLLDAMFQLGLNAKNTFVLGKRYSENEGVVEAIKARGVYYQPCSNQVRLGDFCQNFTQDINWLWSSVSQALEKERYKVDSILILDHGGYALKFTPLHLAENFKLVGLEKTTSGIVNLNASGLLPPFPVINVANCAAKSVLESPLIANAVVEKLLPIIPMAHTQITCAVIGYGSVGRATTHKLLEMGHKVIVYDSDPAKTQALALANVEGVFVTNDLTTSVAFGDLIFGCTGQDITNIIDPFKATSKDKTLVSCTSEDVEFISLLKLIHKQNKSKIPTNPLSDLTYTNHFGAKINIIRGGFPVNFDHSGESVPAQDIQLTRALVLGGVIQAAQLFRQESLLSEDSFVSLDARIQKSIVQQWLRYQPADRFSRDIIERFDDIHWIDEHSPGMKINATLPCVISGDHPYPDDTAKRIRM